MLVVLYFGAGRCKPFSLTCHNSCLMNGMQLCAINSQTYAGFSSSQPQQHMISLMSSCSLAQDWTCSIDDFNLLVLWEKICFPKHFSHARGVALDLLVGWSTTFVQTNIVTIAWIAMEFCANIHSPQRINPNYFGDHFTFLPLHLKSFESTINGLL